MELRRRDDWLGLAELGSKNLRFEIERCGARCGRPQCYVSAYASAHRDWLIRKRGETRKK